MTEDQQRLLNKLKEELATHREIWTAEQWPSRLLTCRITLPEAEMIVAALESQREGTVPPPSPWAKCRCGHDAFDHFKRQGRCYATAQRGGTCTCGVYQPHEAEPSLPSSEAAPAFDFRAHLHRQREFSVRTFGPGARTAGVVDHIRKELREIEAHPSDLSEWIDVTILALDGAHRAGYSPDEIIAALVAKQTKNEGRTWPDWRTQPADKAIEHDRAQPEGASSEAEPPLKGLRRDLSTPENREYWAGVDRIAAEAVKQREAIATPAEGVSLPASAERVIALMRKAATEERRLEHLAAENTAKAAHRMYARGLEHFIRLLSAALSFPEAATDICRVCGKRAYFWSFGSPGDATREKRAYCRPQCMDIETERERQARAVQHLQAAGFDVPPPSGVVPAPQEKQDE